MSNALKVMTGLLPVAMAGWGLAQPVLGASSPARVIFDTDMSGDCDDAGALAVLHKLADKHEAEILACVVNGHDQDEAAAAAVSVINTYYGRPSIPIGAYQGPAYPATKSTYTAQLRDQFPHSAIADNMMPEALDVYRAALASAPNESISIVSVGFLVNLKDLFESPPDSYSPLSGKELIQRKVKRLVVMGGFFPKSNPGGGEYNFAARGHGTDTQFVVEHWPTPILFSGFEIGEAIITGARLAETPKSNPVRRAYELHTRLQGRPSWDLTATLAAVRDPDLYWKIVAGGLCKVSPSGENEWTPATGHRQSYLADKVLPAKLATLLDNLMCEPPEGADGSANRVAK